eukprot:CAMPEP_0174708892 /NCGR_PEP_ID=MMETSP1094-20130205/11020_1 /TAXON_ID=156173 /ORGANISM="Chrysochromulina brevifilum, Strain UTEX LB 985" /LENGTH=57 /DNA_ID=CAMNT_0015907509 /DNA_START=201 /DNA_END=374 /DNA_ORIENTATION=-
MSERLDKPVADLVGDVRTSSVIEPKCHAPDEWINLVEYERLGDDGRKSHLILRTHGP